MISWSTILAEQKVAQVQRQAIMERARQAALVRQIAADRQRKTAFYSRGLSWLGHKLVSWGYDLQGRYDTTFDQTVCDCSAG